MESLRYGSEMNQKIDDAFHKLVEVREELRKMDGTGPALLSLEIAHAIDNIMRARSRTYDQRYQE